MRKGAKLGHVVSKQTREKLRKYVTGLKRGNYKERIDKRKIIFQKIGTCHICISHIGDKNGYPYMTSKHRTFRLHRVIYEEKFGKIKKGLVVRHKCDDVRCININHLELGTPKENSQDMVKRGRSMVGQKNHNHSFEEEDVITIRKSKLSTKALAEFYGVYDSTVRRARIGETYKNVVVKR